LLLASVLSKSASALVCKPLAAPGCGFATPDAGDRCAARPGRDRALAAPEIVSRHLQKNHKIGTGIRLI